MIDADLYRLDGAVGLPSLSTWPSGLLDTRLRSAALDERQGALVLRVNFQLTYYRSVQP